MEFDEHKAWRRARSEEVNRDFLISTDDYGTGTMRAGLALHGAHRAPTRMCGHHSHRLRWTSGARCSASGVIKGLSTVDTAGAFRMGNSRVARGLSIGVHPRTGSCPHLRGGARPWPRPSRAAGAGTHSGPPPA